MYTFITLLAQQDASWLERATGFFQKGGVFMYVLLLCSIASVAVIVFKAISLNQNSVLPKSLADKMNSYSDSGDAASATQVSQELEAGDSVLHRLCRVVVERSDRDGPEELQSAVQANAREELVSMQSGVQVLEVVIVIAPLLGLLGTASGITTVFKGFGSIDDAKMVVMASGVAEALTTTIAGLAVAVPSVIAHSVFNRKIETYAARMEVLLERFSGAMRSHSKDGEEAA